MSTHASSTWSDSLAAWRAGDFERVLRRTQAVFQQLAAATGGVAMPGGFEEADGLLTNLGQRIDAAIDAPPGPGGGDWILATCLYEAGGHTALARDLHETLPRGAAGLILTGTGHRLDEHLTAAAMARTGLDAARIHRLDHKRRSETCRAGIAFLAGQRPARLFLLHHPDDTTAVAIAAAAGARGCGLRLLHHADSTPSCGLFLRGLRIADVIPRAAVFTREELGLRSDWLPLTCADIDVRRSVFLKRGHLTTALTGSVSKIAQASGFRMAEVVGGILRHTRGTHIHIGPLPEETCQELRSAVRAAGLPEERLIHLPQVASLARTLAEQDVDLLVNTWPMGGARAAVEAMAAAVPIVWYSPEPAADRFRMQSAWETAARWRKPADWEGILNAATPEWLEAQSKSARALYEERHHPARWRGYFSEENPAPGPPLPEWADASLLPARRWAEVLREVTGVSAEQSSGMLGKFRRWLRIRGRRGIS